MNIVIEISEELAEKIMADKQAFLDEMLAAGFLITDIRYTTEEEIESMTVLDGDDLLSDRYLRSRGEIE